MLPAAAVAAVAAMRAVKMAEPVEPAEDQLELQAATATAAGQEEAEHNQLVVRVDLAAAVPDRPDQPAVNTRVEPAVTMPAAAVAAAITAAAADRVTMMVPPAAVGVQVTELP